MSYHSVLQSFGAYNLSTLKLWSLQFKYATLPAAYDCMLNEVKRMTPLAAPESFWDSLHALAIVPSPDVAEAFDAS